MFPLRLKKEELKDLGKRIRTLKNSRKGGKTPRELWDIQSEIFTAKRRFRHEHIAYCLVRGRKYEEIEQPAENNKPNWDLIDSLRKALQTKVDEANAEWKKLHAEASNE